MIEEKKPLLTRLIHSILGILLLPHVGGGLIGGVCATFGYLYWGEDLQYTLLPFGIGFVVGGAFIFWLRGFLQKLDKEGKL